MTLKLRLTQDKVDAWQNETAARERPQIESFHRNQSACFGRIPINVLSGAIGSAAIGWR
jgi:hypothetical protein